MDIFIDSRYIREYKRNKFLMCTLIKHIFFCFFLCIRKGMYKFIGLSENSTNFINSNHIYNNIGKENIRTSDDSIKTKKYRQDCNSYEDIQRLEEGGIIDDWTLQGVLFLVRHGDRGPMAHVRGINSVDCSSDQSSLLKKYKYFLSNATASTQVGGGHASWIRTGAFHGFPLLPPSTKTCFLGQLTPKGLAQELKIGDILKQAYGISLDLYNKDKYNINHRSNLTNNTDHQQTVNDIVIYSTRYRRTFQSAMALMFSFLSPDKWINLLIQESHSLSFCFHDCACPHAEQLKKVVSRESQHLLSQHPAVSAVVQWVGTTLLQNPSEQMNPLEVRDAILSIICHNAPLPCHKLLNAEQQDYLSTSTIEPYNSDVINIDQDDSAIPQRETKEPEDLISEPELEGCIEQSHITALMSYTHWQGLKETRSKYHRRSGLLRAYGLIRHIVSFMLKMISGEKIKFVLYSGHDRTMQYILAALGLQISNPFIPYAARLNFEVYKSDKDTQFYFRVLYNGHDMTRQIEFCEGGKSLRVNRGGRGEKADLCPIENIIRFIHDDYFTPLNASNYKDACFLTKDND